MTPDARYVAFSSLASNLVPGDTNDAADIFVKDMTTGAVERVSVTSSGEQTTASPDAGGLNSSDYPCISPDGRYVTFTSWANNLAPGALDSVTHVYLHDRVTGLTEIEDVNNAGQFGDWGA